MDGAYSHCYNKKKMKKKLKKILHKNVKVGKRCMKEAGKMLTSLFRRLTLPPEFPSTRRGRRGGLSSINDQAFTAFEIQVNASKLGWHTKLISLLENCKGAKVKMDRKGVVEVSGVTNPNELLRKIGLYSKQIELRALQFGQCSSNLFMPVNDPPPPTEMKKQHKKKEKESSALPPPPDHDWHTDTIHPTHTAAAAAPPAPALLLQPNPSNYYNQIISPYNYYYPQDYNYRLPLGYDDGVGNYYGYEYDGHPYGRQLFSNPYY